MQFPVRASTHCPQCRAPLASPQQQFCNSCGALVNAQVVLGAGGSMSPKKAAPLMAGMPQPPLDTAAMWDYNTNR